MLKLRNVKRLVVLQNVKPTKDLLSTRLFSSNNGPRPQLQRSAGQIGVHGYSLLAIPVLTFGLGTWQVYRRQWKLDLIENLKRRTSAPPLPLPSDFEDLSDMEYRKFEMIGKFDHEKEIYIGPRSLIDDTKKETGGLISSGQSGYLVITPFKLSDSNVTVLVNRGWVPRKKMNPSTRPLGQTENEIRLVGVYRPNEKRPQFVAKNQPNDRLFHYRDVETMARQLDTAPVFFDADIDSSAPDGPIGGQTVVTVRNEHVSYILTWYSLSIITAFLWYRRFVKKLPLM